ncbi:helix-turn-helix transcriptional regulator [Streptomyces sp. NPDC054863]
MVGVRPLLNELDAGHVTAGLSRLGKCWGRYWRRCRPIEVLQAASRLPVPWSTAPPPIPLPWPCWPPPAATTRRSLFTYRRGSGETGPRRVEPHALVAADPVSYLVAYDTGHDAWHLFRVDRLTDPASTGHRVTPRELPAPNAAAYVGQSLTAAPTRLNGWHARRRQQISTRRLDRESWAQGIADPDTVAACRKQHGR